METIKEFTPVCVSFHHPYDSRCGIKCYTKIRVKEFRYTDNSDNIVYYKIIYKHLFVDGNGSSPALLVHPHPFVDEQDKMITEFTEGNLIVKNPLTEKMVEFLLMKDSKLSKFIGNSCPKEYRRTIIHDIARKWD